MLYLYGFDGSGVGMRCKVTPVLDEGETTVVHFDGFVPPLDSMTETELTDKLRRVRTKDLSAGGDAPLASMNFLD